MENQNESPVLLYVEDDPVISIMTTAVLEDAGFKTIIASTGHAALDLLVTESSRIAGLITDVNLESGPSGWDIARHARFLLPGIPVVYTSSVSEAAWMLNGVPLSKLVIKPFRPSRIVQTISALIAVSERKDEQRLWIMAGSASEAQCDIRATLLARRAALARLGPSSQARRRERLR